MITVTAKLQNVDQLRTLLTSTLPDETKLKALRPSVREMGLITLGYAISNSPYRTGALRRNIKLIRQKTTMPWEEWNGLRVKTARAKTRRLGMMEGTEAGEKRSEAKGADDPYYWFWQEIGWQVMTRGGKKGKKMPEKKFMRNALELHTSQCINEFNRAFVTRLYAVVRKNARQALGARR